MPAIDAIELGKWERGETEPWRIVRWPLGLWHNLLPRLLNWTTSPIGLVLGFLRLACATLLALWPIWAKLYNGPTNLPSWDQAVVESLVTFGCLAFMYIYDRLSVYMRAKKEKARLLERLSLDLCGTVMQFSGAVKLRTLDQKPKILGLRKKLLECIRRVAEIHITDYSGTYLEVTMLLFNDAGCKSMRISERATAQRPCGKVVDSSGIMAFYVARSGKHRVINDFRRNHPFPKTGISDPKHPYRSVLLIPLLDRETAGPDTCVGLLAIDSSRPYHFWAGGGDDLVVKLAPYCAWLTLLLNLEDQHRLSCVPA